MTENLLERLINCEVELQTFKCKLRECLTVYDDAVIVRDDHKFRALLDIPFKGDKDDEEDN